MNIENIEMKHDRLAQAQIADAVSALFLTV
jgi:hypothetical protein